MNLFILLFLVHCIDDFVLQPICLSKLKQQDWWLKNVPNQPRDKNNKKLYRNDYKMALAIHAFEWSASLSVILMFFNAPDWFIGVAFIVNGIIHMYVDDAKANRHMISLVFDQTTHILQIIATVVWFYAVQ